MSYLSEAVDINSVWLHFLFERVCRHYLSEAAFFDLSEEVFYT
jgi:hypothetical protein